jgi:hypothetical protein
VWDELMFYEQIAERPPLLLRVLLPLPIRSVGHPSQVGDVAKCLYEGGDLSKRVTHIDRGRSCAFEIIEQNLEIGRGIQLLGGGYKLRELPDGCTEVVILTRYLSTHLPRWVWNPIEAAVCRVFHLHILSAMRRSAESRELRRVPARAGVHPSDR